MFRNNWIIKYWSRFATNGSSKSISARTPQISEKEKAVVKKIVRRAVQDYGETIKLLEKE